jgi:hypothetical protein
VSKKPSPALAVSAVALFVALGGTGLAASHGHEAAKKHATSKALTPTRVKKLIAAYLHAHPHPGPRGPQGLSGATGGPGQSGPQGPGAKQIVSSAAGALTPTPIATVGPWTVRFGCLAGVSVNITGPGNYYNTTVAGAPGTATTTTTHINNGALGESGVTANTNANTQLSEDVELISGATMYEVHLQMTATGSGAGSCTVAGSATPVD